MQLVFCDLSTPKGDGSFNVYDDIKAKLFAKVRWGQVRVLIGSTEKMGAGMNCHATCSQMKKLCISPKYLRLKGD